MNEHLLACVVLEKYIGNLYRYLISYWLVKMSFDIRNRQFDNAEIQIFSSCQSNLPWGLTKWVIILTKEKKI